MRQLTRPALGNGLSLPFFAGGLLCLLVTVPMTGARARDPPRLSRDQRNRAEPVRRPLQGAEVWQRPARDVRRVPGELLTAEVDRDVYHADPRSSSGPQ